jgi:hypothetical protein
MVGFRNNIQNLEAAFGTTFKVTGGFRKAETSLLKSVTGMIFTI